MNAIAHTPSIPSSDPPRALGGGGRTVTCIDRWLLAALLLYAVGLALWVLASGLRLTEEDAYYYYAIAQHIARGDGSTFDGLHLTNGYHPLWLLCLVPLFWLTSSREVALALGLLLQGALMAAGMALLYANARLTLGRVAASLAVLLWPLLMVERLLSGLEFCLYALCVLSVMYMYLRWFGSDKPSRSARTYFTLGVLLSLAFLARLDTLLLALLVSLAVIARDRSSTPAKCAGRVARRDARAGLSAAALKRWLALVLPLFVVAAAYALINLWLFGAPLPVSSALKPEWGEYLLSLDPHYVAQGWLSAKFNQSLWPFARLDSNFGQYLVVGSYGSAAAWLAVRLTPRLAWPAPLRVTLRAWQPFILFGLFNFLSYTLLLHGALVFASWYYVAQPLLAVLLVAALADTLSRRTLLRVALVAVCLALPLLTIRNLAELRERQRTGVAHDPLTIAAQWARANLPRDAVIGAWNAGTIGYLSERRTINLDGVANSWLYFETERYDLCAYWQRNGVTVLLDAFEDKRALSVAPTYPAYARCADQLELMWSVNPYDTSWRMEAYRIRPAPSTMQTRRR